jgi:ABC-type oligopeptide transport system ATPase subunit
MTFPRVLGLAGHSGSGKTSLAERLVPALAARGLSVAYLKHDAHRFQMDKPGKDTFRVYQAGAVAVAAAGAYIISKHQATERQRKIAEQRARLYLARQEKMQADAQAAKKTKRPRYLAVQTEKTEQNQGKAAVMVFDTQTNEVVGNNVYDMKSTPQVGQTAKFDTYSAQFVGTGN